MRLSDPGAAPTQPDGLGQALARLTAHDASATERARQVAALGRHLAGGARPAGGIALDSLKRVPALVADLLTEAAPHLPVRDLLTLRSHHGGLSGEDLADALVRNAARATAAVGAVGGTVSSGSLIAPATLLAAPVTLAAETLAVVAVELKLVAELHVLYGRAPVGTRSQVATAYLTSWAQRRGLDASASGTALVSVLSGALRQQLRARVVRRLGRNLSTLAPMLTGAVAGAELNRRETTRLGAALRADLRDPAGPARRGGRFRRR